MTTTQATRYGRTVYFDGGKVAEITSAHQEWTDDLARLIAAAPEMLQALRDLCFVHSGIGEPDDPCVASAKVLLAKIEGK